MNLTRQLKLKETLLERAYQKILTLEGELRELRTALDRTLQLKSLIPKTSLSFQQPTHSNPSISLSALATEAKSSPIPSPSSLSSPSSSSTKKSIGPCPLTCIETETESCQKVTDAIIEILDLDAEFRIEDPDPIFELIMEDGREMMNWSHSKFSKLFRIGNSWLLPGLSSLHSGTPYLVSQEYSPLGSHESISALD